MAGNPTNDKTLDSHQLQQLAEAEAALRSGHLSRAAGQARTLALQAPHAVDAWHILAVALAQSDDAMEALGPFRKALELAPDNPALLANFATALRRVGQVREAVPLWQRAVGLAPTFAQAWLDLGLTEMDLEHAEAARDALQHAVRLMLESATAWHGLGNSLALQGRTREAEQAFRSALECNAHHPHLWINLGQLLRRQARVSEALECFARAHELGGETPQLLDAQAGALLDMGRVEEAMATARRMTQGFPQYAPGQRTLAQMIWEYAEDGSHGHLALSGFAAAVQACPDDVNLRLGYIQLLRQIGHSEHALEHIGLLRARGDSPVLKRAQADTLEELGRSGQAAPLYHELYRDQAHREPGLLNAFTRHCLKTGQWRRAQSLSAEAISIDPDNQEAWAYRAIAWRQLGDEREYWLCDYERLVTMVEIEPPPGFADNAAFLRVLEGSLHALHRAVRQPVQQSLRKGTQTAGSLFGRDDPAIAALERAICKAALRWIDTLPDDPGHPFLRRRSRDIRVRGSWSVKLTSSGHHVNHIHQEGWMSTAFYVSLPACMQGAWDDAGCIRFGQPPEDLGLKLAARRVLRPQPGYLALFPSYMWHGTVPFGENATRLSVACDITPAG